MQCRFRTEGEKEGDKVKGRNLRGKKGKESVKSKKDREREQGKDGKQCERQEKTSPMIEKSKNRKKREIQKKEGHLKGTRGKLEKKKEGEKYYKNKIGIF